MDDEDVPTDLWVYYCAKRLKMHWRTVDPVQLDELAEDLARDARLRGMSPLAAAALWLEPVASPRERPEPFEPDIEWAGEKKGGRSRL